MQKKVLTSSDLWRGILLFRENPIKLLPTGFRHKEFFSFVESDFLPCNIGRKNANQGTLNVSRYLLGSSKPCTQFSIESAKMWRFFFASNCNTSKVAKAAKEKAMTGFFPAYPVRNPWVGGGDWLFIVPFVPRFMLDVNKNYCAGLALTFAAFPKNAVRSEGGGAKCLTFGSVDVFNAENNS